MNYIASTTTSGKNVVQCNVSGLERYVCVAKKHFVHSKGCDSSYTVALKTLEFK